MKIFVICIFLSFLVCFLLFFVDWMGVEPLFLNMDLKCIIFLNIDIDMDVNITPTK